MSEEKKVTFMESVQLFDEMIVEKYFKTAETEDLMLCIAGNAAESTLHVTACGNSMHLAQALLEACKEDKNIQRVVMMVAARISVDTMIHRMAKGSFGLDKDREEEGDD